MQKQNYTSTERALKLIVRSSVIVLTTVVLSKLLTWIYRVLIARFYGPESYGIYSILIMILSLFVTFGSLGFIDGLFRFVPKYIGENKKRYAKYLVNYSIFALIISGVISAILLYLFSDYFAIHLFKDIKFSRLLKIFSPLILVWMFSNLFLTLINSFEKIGWHSLLSDVLSNLSRLIIIIFLILIGFSRNAIFISYGLSLIILFIASYFVFRYFSSRILIGKKIPENVKKEIRKDFISYSWPVIFSGSIGKLNFWTDSLIIGFFLAPLQVGFYNAAVPIALLLHIIPELFYPLFLPLITRTIASKNNLVARDISKQLGKWIFMINLPIFLFLFIFPGVFINFIFGKEFLIAEYSLRILSVGAFISSFLYMSQRLLLVYGKSQVLLMNSIIAFISNIILNIILVPKYGIMGAAIATSSVWIVLGIIFTIQSSKFTSIISLRRNMITILLLSIIPLIIILVLRNLVVPSTVSIMLGGILFLVVYGILIYLFGLDKNDILILKAIKAKVISSTLKNKCFNAYNEK
ncbi:flippase [Candidatus Pacearchaeota archaeon]|nr:flippase [Candidatus Pacearchaeota archaeon]